MQNCQPDKEKRYRCDQHYVEAEKARFSAKKREQNAKNDRRGGPERSLNFTIIGFRPDIFPRCGQKLLRENAVDDVHQHPGSNRYGREKTGHRFDDLVDGGFVGAAKSAHDRREISFDRAPDAVFAAHEDQVGDDECHKSESCQPAENAASRIPFRDPVGAVLSR